MTAPLRPSDITLEGMGEQVRARLAGTVIEVRIHGHRGTRSTPWVPMTGWGVRQPVLITITGWYDAIEFRDQGGPVLFGTGISGDRAHGVPVQLAVGDTVSIMPGMTINGVQVLP